MKVLVTGGSGFIGTYVCEELIAQGHEPLSFDHHRHDDREMFLGDVRDAAAVTEAAAHVDGIIHLAAVLGTQETITNPRPAAEVNILGALNIFEAAAQYDLPVVYAGVGNHWMRDHGTGAYTISKTASEDFARMYSKYRSGRISVVRPVNAYGPRQSVAAPYGSSKVRKITPAFVCRALSNMPIEVYGSGNQISDMVYVTDVARVMVAALGSNVFGPIGVGPAQSSTVNEIAQRVNQEVFGDAPAPALVHLPMRPGEVPDAVVSVGENAQYLEKIGIDWDSFVSIDDGIRTTVQWYRDNEGTTWHRPE
jgi:UDP-glucose 4-epimerase